jgi:hypothetical protein
MSEQNYSAAGASQPFDPIRFCVFTTVALLAWAFGAPVVVMAMSGLGIWAYRRAMRAGLRETKCVLRKPRLVLLYLGVAFTLGAAGLVRAAVRAFAAG